VKGYIFNRKALNYIIIIIGDFKPIRKNVRFRIVSE